MHLVISIISLLQFAFAPPATSNSSNVISFTVHGVEINKGNIRVGLFNSSNGFPVTGNQFKGYEFDVKKGERTYKLHNIPKGNYALGLYHDENANGKLDKNFLGMPTEKYGFSNDARGTFSAPSYESARFYHDGSTYLTINIY